MTDPTNDFRTTVGSLLECSVCLSLLCEPISISCGHTFCRVCLAKSLRRHRKQCPSCREVCHISAEYAAENIILKSMAESYDPELYRVRAAEAAAEKANWSAEYPIFLYNQAMLPGNRLGLHLFEPRYKLMMQRIINSSRCFAYLCTRYSVGIGDVALVAELNEAEFLADGRCILNATLKKRSRVVNHYVEDGTQGLHYCTLEPLRDHPIRAEEESAVQALRQRAVALSEQLLSVGQARRLAEAQFGPMPTADLELFSMWFASICPLSENEKMLALSVQDTGVRLLECCRVAEAHIARRDRAQSFPLASALGATIASTISAIMGGGGAGGGGAEAAATGDEQGAGTADDNGPDEVGVAENDSGALQETGDGMEEDGNSEGSESSGGLPGYSH